MFAMPALVDYKGKKQYRIIPSSYPPINFFEDLVDASEMQALWEIESLTNERLRQEAGDIALVHDEDRVSGAGASVVMAAFTHLSRPTRFSDGSYGIYYASLTLETAIFETVYHREIFLKATNEEPCELIMRVYEGNIAKPFHDVRENKYIHLHDPADYVHSQSFGRELRDKHSWGIIYNSVRHEGGYCIAALRPPAVSIPHQTSHLRYCFNGSHITEVLGTTSLVSFKT